MSGTFTVTADMVALQRMASDPLRSAWVSANAGSGKTYVLTRRVVRLMLAGTPPGAILCLTFTKAAAATMSNRVLDLLASWAVMTDEALTRALEDLDGAPPTAERRLRARRLFARALETPGGLKVQTIHAFCERLLHQFPFEANVPSQFTVLDDAASKTLVASAKSALWERAAANPEGPLGRALATLSMTGADQTVAELLDEIVDKRAQLKAYIRSDADLARALAELPDWLGLNPGETLENLRQDIIGEALIPRSEWRSVAATFEHVLGTAPKHDVAGLLRQADLGGPSASETYCSIFLNNDDEPRKHLPAAAVRKAEPALASRFDAEKQRLADLMAKMRAARIAEGTSALLTLGHEIIDHIERAKAARGALDFDDLVTKAGALFDNDGASAWVLYKLDQGIDHILVDEAQDTSPAQWRIVEKLVDEFASGEGARAIPRTLFVVGDEKQSIYSFQGADPRWFDDMRRHFERAFRKASLPFTPLELKHSFRSAPAVLTAVDAVFADANARRGLSADDVEPPPHLPARVGAPGVVELWPLAEATKIDRDDADWTAPVDAIGAGDPIMLLAATIARRVRLWLDPVTPLLGRSTPMVPGDVLILVRRRGALFDALIRALKQAGVPVAGADRLVLGDHIAVQDLVALGDCLVTPDDDLSLAVALKSPLFGLTEDELLRLCLNRRGSLWDRLVDADHPAAQTLARWRDEALSITPGAFYAAVLARDGIRTRILARLGPEAIDALDEFLSLALGFDQRDVPTLAGFLHAFRASEVVVKRDMDVRPGEVRVMTVHGAKGLEASTVILADTMSVPGHAHDPKVLGLTPVNQPSGTPERLAWAPSASADIAPTAAARLAHREAQEREYRRLLYVAMTRAADRLVICGAKPGRDPVDPWYQLIKAQLQDRAEEQAAEDGDGMVYRWTTGAPAALSATTPQTTNEQAPPRPRPAWLSPLAGTPTRSARSLAPSRASSPASGPENEARKQAMRRGVVIHRLLQSLPDVAPERRADAARRYLSSDKSLYEASRAEIMARVLALLDDARFSSLFGPESRAEVPLVGMVKGLPVAGQIDRLVITPERVVIADFKTGLAVPASADAVPASYVTQLALYRALLSEMRPGVPVEALIVWADVAEATSIPAAMMDENLAALTGALPGTRRAP
ncbi:MAG: double-strand break repair helicase AddA [Alphaproteobacteria bacterium]